jgi:hypothetical protein
MPQVLAFNTQEIAFHNLYAERGKLIPVYVNLIRPVGPVPFQQMPGYFLLVDNAAIDNITSGMLKNRLHML